MTNNTYAAEICKKKTKNEVDAVIIMSKIHTRENVRKIVLCMKKYIITTSSQQE